MKNKFLLTFLTLAITGGYTANQASAQSKQRYKVAVADIYILKRQKLGAFELAKTIGTDGVEVDMGGLGDRDHFDNQLTADSTRDKFLAAAKATNVEISSISMGGFFSQSFANRPNSVSLVTECINTMVRMNVKIGFLPLGINSDLGANPEYRPAIVSKLKEVGKIAQKAGVTIAIGTTLSAQADLDLLKEVNSPAIKIYYNFQSALDAGRDLEKELELLGKNNIAIIHCTDTDGKWLQNDPKIDLKKVKATLDKMGWSGWLVMERSRDAADVHNVKKNYSANAAYVKSVFQ